MNFFLPYKDLWRKNNLCLEKVFTLKNKNVKNKTIKNRLQVHIFDYFSYLLYLFMLNLIKICFTPVNRT